MSYILFGGDYYYPEGGLDDWIGVYDSVEDAMAAVGTADWAHIAHLATLVKVKTYVANGNEKVDGEWRQAPPRWSDVDPG